jgi:hypothetical protein
MNDAVAGLYSSAVAEYVVEAPEPLLPPAMTTSPLFNSKAVGLLGTVKGFV